MKKQASNESFTLTSMDVARVLGVSTERVRQLARAGVLSCIEVGRGWRIYGQQSVDAARRDRAKKEGRHE